MPESAIHQRLRSVVATKTYRELGDMTGTNAETARRYILGQPPSLEFVVALCDKQGVSPTWLLTGDGPMRASEARSHALREANAHELLAAVADTLERLAERVGRLEVFLHTLETRLRVVGAEGGGESIGTGPGSGGKAHGPSVAGGTQPGSPRPRSDADYIADGIEPGPAPEDGGGPPAAGDA
jgi:hypothetical protein